MYTVHHDGSLHCVVQVSRLSVPATLQLLERAYCLAAQCRVSKAKLLWAYVRGHRLQAQDVFHVDEESMSEHVKQQLKLFIDRVQVSNTSDARDETYKHPHGCNSIIRPHAAHGTVHCTGSNQ